MSDASVQKPCFETVMRATPEKLFGDLPHDQAAQSRHIRQTYRRLSRELHPDRYTDLAEKRCAEEAFKALNRHLEHALKKIAEGTYGEPDPIILTTASRTYRLGAMKQGDLADVYACAFEQDTQQESGFLKIVRHPADNDLVDNEAKTLSKLKQRDEIKELHACFPDLLESFSIKDDGATRRVNAFAGKEMPSLADVLKAYPKGIDPRDMAWMYKRLLGVLWATHASGIVHGAVLPEHILLDLQSHGIVLVDWCYAVASGSRLKAISANREPLYPPEAGRKEGVTPAADLYMAARCMCLLLGGQHEAPSSTPDGIRMMLKACMFPWPSQRPQDALWLHEEFNQLIRRLFGPPKFRDLAIPN